MKLEAKYYINYTLGSYADGIMSLPIGIARGISKSAVCLCDKVNCGTPEFFKWDETTQKSPTYQKRQTLRDKLDTEQGVKFLQSNLAGLPPFFLIGIPAAEGMQRLIEKNMADSSEIVQYIANSLGTIAIQMWTGYAAFILNEIRTNKQKYVNENGKLSLSKIGDGMKKTINAFLTFDLTYAGLKIAGQSTMLALKKSPAIASAVADAVVLPVYYAVAISLGLSKGLIETKETKNLENKISEEVKKKVEKK